MSEKKNPGSVAEVALPESIKARIEKGEVLEWTDLMAALAQPPAIQKVGGAVPMPRQATPSQVEALKRLPEVYAKVVPDTVRTLTPSEVTTLLRERAVLKEVEAMVAARLKDISLTALNHNDVDFEEHKTERATEAKTGIDGEPFITKEGHVAAPTKIYPDDPAVDEHLSVEVRAGSISSNADRLREMAADPDDDRITHEEYLAMTTQVRIFDEAKAMLALRKKPRLLAALRECASTGAHTVSVYVRKSK